jgi:hypothetical protein
MNEMIYCFLLILLNTYLSRNVLIKKLRILISCLTSYGVPFLPNNFVVTWCLFYRVPEHRSFRDLPQRMQALCAVELRCSEVR